MAFPCPEGCSTRVDDGTPLSSNIATYRGRSSPSAPWKRRCHRRCSETTRTGVVSTRSDPTARSKSAPNSSYNSPFSAGVNGPSLITTGVAISAPCSPAASALTQSTDANNFRLNVQYPTPLVVFFSHFGCVKVIQVKMLLYCSTCQLNSWNLISPES